MNCCFRWAGQLKPGTAYPIEISVAGQPGSDGPPGGTGTAPAGPANGCRSSTSREPVGGRKRGLQERIVHQRFSFGADDYEGFWEVA